MELNWLQSLGLGLVSGLTDILPVSSQAHQTILLTFFGEDSVAPVTRLVIHLATLLTVLISVREQIGRIRSQQKLARMPRRRRNRPVEMTALMDGKIVGTALVPIALMLLLHSITRGINGLLLLAGVSLINAVVLYLPSLVRTADKDSRMVSPLEGVFMGLGAGASAIPGLSSIGVSYSVGVVHGMDKKYMVHLALLMHLIFTAGMIVYDVFDIVNQGMPSVDLMVLAGLAVTALGSIIGTIMGIQGLDRAARQDGLTGFSFYSFGVALFTFILYLVV